jgi:hypothetical protein
VTALLVALRAAAADGGDERDRSGTGMAAGFPAASSGDLANVGRLDSVGMNAVDTCCFGIWQNRLLEGMWCTFLVVNN